jgi:hypothetical protein
VKKYSIGNSGCSVYMLCDPGEFEMTYSEDSSMVFTAECKPDSVSYGIICVKLKETVATGDEAENLLISYLDYLKTAFKIKSSAGYGKGHTLSSKADARGIIDYWTDEEENDWQVKAWADGKIISVLYVFKKGKLENQTKYEVFLNGFRFPGT